MTLEYFNLYFPGWMNEVNTIVYNETGFNCDELPDQFYADNFEAGMNPNDMALFVLYEYNGRREQNISDIP